MTKEIKDLSKNIKKLTPADLRKEGKKLDAQDEFFVTIAGTEYKITHDVYFRKTKQRDVLEDMLGFFSYIGEANAEIAELASPYAGLLIAKHFTSLEVPDDIDEALDFLELLIDLDVLGAIINALPEGETIKIYELIKETVDNVKTNIEDAEAEAIKMSEQIDNPEILAIENKPEDFEEYEIVEPEDEVEAETDGKD